MVCVSPGKDTLTPTSERLSPFVSASTVIL